MEENRGNSACGHLLILMYCYLMWDTGPLLLHVPKPYLPIKVGCKALEVRDCTFFFSEVRETGTGFVLFVSLW